MKKVLLNLLAISLLLVAAQPGALANKKKETLDPRLKQIKTVYVRGNNGAASYIRWRLEKDTCLSRAKNEDQADAILDVSLDISHPLVVIFLTLTDRLSEDVLWVDAQDNTTSNVKTTVESLVSVLFDRLNRVCCRGRRR